MRQFCVQNFITTRSPSEELSCKRPDTLTDSIVYERFEYTKYQSENVNKFFDIAKGEVRVKIQKKLKV
jgi:hypothetical protein